MPEATKVALTPQFVEKQIQLAAATVDRFSAHSVGEIITRAMGEFDGDPQQAEKVAQSLVNQKVFEPSADCPDPLSLAEAVVGRYQQYGESLQPQEKPL